MNRTNVNDEYMIDFDFESGEGYSMKFLAKEICGMSQNKETQAWDIPLYGYNVNSDDWEHGDEVVHGFIKWDGCGHWYFSEYQHLCGRRNVLSFIQMIQVIVDKSREMEHYMESVAE